MYINAACVNTRCFSLVNLSFFLFLVSLICRALAGVQRRAEGKFFPLPYRAVREPLQGCTGRVS